MGSELYDDGSWLSVPGLEGTFEYGDVADVLRSRFPSAYLLNDRRLLEQSRLSEITGLHSDPDARETRQDESDQHGERAGKMFYAGRNVGFTGKVVAGSIPAVRDVGDRLLSSFGTRERDLLVHGPNEVPLAVNEFMFDITSLHWNASGDTFGLVTDGQLEVLEFGDASVTSATSLRAQRESLADWNGEDIWLYANFKVEVGSTPASEIRLSVRAVYPGSSSSVIVDFQATPVTGNWYELKGRLPAASLDPRTQHVGIDFVLIAGATTAYTVHVRRPAFVLVSEDDPDPVGWFSGDLAGFEYEGIKELSRSYGPCYAVNEIDDVDFQFGEEVFGILPDWAVTTATGVTINQQPIQARGWSGDYTKAAYAIVAKDNNATSRTFSIAHSTPFVVASGRTYRWSTKVNVVALPPTGTLVARISWYDGGSPGSVISTVNSSTVLATGETDLAAEGVAPAGAIFARVSIVHLATTTALTQLQIFWADPCFLDLTDFDQSAFFGDGLHETVRSIEAPSKARRLITRPFLLRRVRKASSGITRPEQQPDTNYRRNFTIGLRASDPRIYALDERHAQIEMVGTPKFVVRPAPTDFTLGTATLPVPAGFTYEGHFVTNPGGDNQPFVWGQRTRPFTSPGYGSTTYPYPSNGVGMQFWDSVGHLGDTYPANDINARAYRSAEAYTYTTPKVIIAGAPFGLEVPGNSDLVSGGWIWGADSSSNVYWNTLMALIKRVSSGTWLELRWNSVRKDFFAAHPTWAAIPNLFATSPYSLELWCSHNTSGTLATTRLAAVDLTSGTTNSLPYPPITAPYYLVSWMLDNVVFWEIWSAYPSEIDFSKRLETGSFSLPAGLQSVIGTGVAGHAGWGMRASKGDPTGNPKWSAMAQVPPYLSYFESSDASLPPKVVTTPVIGTIDTPQRIQIRGDLVDPILQISTPGIDGDPGRTSVARFTGTVFESDPLTIDLADNSVRDGLGNNRRSYLVPGSDFAKFQPGINYVSLQAKSWGDYPAHLVTSWRDAFR